MKKICILILILLFTTINVFAASYPRWNSQPIYVYMPKCGNYSVLMNKAFKAWQTKSKNLVRFQYVSNPNDAGIVVNFVNASTDCNSDFSVGCTRYTKMRGGYLVKVGIDIATKEVVKANSDFKIVPRSPEHLYGVMLHEIGHALGFQNHSKNSKSIMYMYDLESLQYLTDEDMKLLYSKYH